MSGEAAFSLENLRDFPKQCSDAGNAPASFLVAESVAHRAHAL